MTMEVKGKIRRFKAGQKYTVKHPAKSCKRLNLAVFDGL